MRKLVKSCRLLLVLAWLASALAAYGRLPRRDTICTHMRPIMRLDTLKTDRKLFVLQRLEWELDSLERFTRLVYDDFASAADELDVDVATIMAVVEVEAGESQLGFSNPGIPVINFDRNLFASFLSDNNIDTTRYIGSEAFGGLQRAKYRTENKAQWARLRAARIIDRITADKATFWGMFQIGGFNWHKCGVGSLDEFVDHVSYSERMQLQLFVNFLKHSEGICNALRKKDWARFAFLYNGPKYEERGYHTKLESAYNKFITTI